MSHFLTEQRLRAIFMDFDTDNNGKITPDNIVVAFSKLGLEVTMEETKEMVRKHDGADKDGAIDFEEFREVFLGNTKPLFDVDALE